MSLGIAGAGAGSSSCTLARSKRSGKRSRCATGQLANWLQRVTLGSRCAGRHRLSPWSGAVDLDSWWDRFVAARLDTAPGTQRNYRKAKERFSSLLGSRDPHSLSVADVQEAVGALAEGIEATTLHKYVNTLRQVLDFAGVEPNVARDRRVKLPSIVREEPEPPDAPQVVAMLGKLTWRWLLAFITAEQTAMRVGEVASVAWGDVDVVGSRFRLRARETKSRRAKWVPVPAWLIEEIAASCPPEDRSPERLVFFRVTEDGLRNAMLRACRDAGIAVYSPHDLRHRRITLWHHAGVPTKEIQERAGHARASVTLDVAAVHLDAFEAGVAQHQDDFVAEPHAHRELALFACYDGSADPLLDPHLELDALVERVDVDHAKPLCVLAAVLGPPHVCLCRPWARKLGALFGRPARPAGRTRVRHLVVEDERPAGLALRRGDESLPRPARASSPNRIRRVGSSPWRRARARHCSTMSAETSQPSASSPARSHGTSSRPAPQPASRAGWPRSTNR